MRNTSPLKVIGKTIGKRIVPDLEIILKKKNRHQTQINTSWLWKCTLVRALPLLGITLFAVLSFYYSHTLATANFREATESRVVDSQKKHLHSDLQSVISDLRFLAEEVEAHPSSELQHHQSISETFRRFAGAKSTYHQLRLLTTDGMEAVRTNCQAGIATLVATKQLQNKKGRYYFEDTLALGRNEIFVSPLDLNMEHGEIEIPLRPMIRFGTPVFDRQGGKSGIVLVNYLAQRLLTALRELGASSAGSTLLLNNAGFYLQGEHAEQEWGFMFPDQQRGKQSFYNDHPSAWAQIATTESGQFETATGLFTFTTARPPTTDRASTIDRRSKTDNGSALVVSDTTQIPQENFWKLVTFVPITLLHAEQRALQQALALFTLIFATLITVGAYKVSLGHCLRQKSEQKREALITEFKEANRQLKAAQCQMVHQEKMASIGQLAAGVAHEINNPTGFITSNLVSLGKYTAKLNEHIAFTEQLITPLQNQEVNAAIQQHQKKLRLPFIQADLEDLIAESLEGTGRIKAIVQNLKSFSRVDDGGAAINNLHECLDAALSIGWNEIKYHATVSKDYHPIPDIYCSAQQLNQVFLNLLVNAAQALKDQGKIHIATATQDPWVIIQISDNGCGIASEHLSRIFDPFFTTKDVGKGTGLGLSICYDIIHKHHGEITVDSEIGLGTTFTIKLPIITGAKLSVTSPNGAKSNEM